MIHKLLMKYKGVKLHCKNWQIEAPIRMLLNNLNPEVAEDYKNLIVYGGTGKAARSWEDVQKIIKALQNLKEDETLLVQSGRVAGIFRTTEFSPRVLIANSLLVPAWANWDYFRELEAKGLIMYGQMTAGSWIYIGTQGILQGTFETFAACGKKHFGGNLEGKLIVSSGLGGMGGAQPLAATMNGATFLGIEVDPKRIEKRIKTGYCDVQCNDLEQALKMVLDAKAKKQAISVAYQGNAATVLDELVKRNITPDILTDQTSAHDLLNGYIPENLTVEEAERLRKDNPAEYISRSKDTIVKHVNAMLELQKRGSIVFEYGNNLRKQAELAGVKNAFAIPGFVQEYIRPMFCEGRGPFRWVALSGNPDDIYETDKLVLKLFPEDRVLERWIKLAHEKVKFQGLPARVCWLGYGERAKFGLAINELVKKGKVKAPIVIGRDHLDTGSVASPYRETEGMLDGSDAVADWPVLNALLNTASGATWVSVHHGGGVGIGYSIHAGMVIVADGNKGTAKKLELVLNNDPGIGIVRHKSAGYPTAAKVAKKFKIKTL